MLYLTDVLENQRIKIVAPQRALEAFSSFLTFYEQKSTKERILKSAELTMGVDWEQEEIEFEGYDEQGSAYTYNKPGQWTIDVEHLESSEARARKIFDSLLRLGFSSAVEVEKINPLESYALIGLSERAIKEHATLLGGVQKMKRLIKFAERFRESIPIAEQEGAPSDITYVMTYVLEHLSAQGSKEALEKFLDAIENAEDEFEFKKLQEELKGFQIEQSIGSQSIKKIALIEEQRIEACAWEALSEGCLAIKDLQGFAFSVRFSDRYGKKESEQEERFKKFPTEACIKLFNTPWRDGFLAPILLEKEYLDTLLLESVSACDWVRSCTDFGKRSYVHFVLKNLHPKMVPLGVLSKHREFLEEQRSSLSVSEQDAIDKLFDKMSRTLEEQLKKAKSGAMHESATVSLIEKEYLALETYKKKGSEAKVGLDKKSTLRL